MKPSTKNGGPQIAGRLLKKSKFNMDDWRYRYHDFLVLGNLLIFVTCVAPILTTVLRGFNGCLIQYPVFLGVSSEEF